ncbi:MAG: spore germination protein [Firmicutes bacterium]|nr:spore germination protein [Bacillota bacterium]MCL1953818.1 spore germination protein [Bacillota bacterium]
MIDFNQIKQALYNPSDLANRDIVLGNGDIALPITVVYIEGLASSTQMHFMLSALLQFEPNISQTSNEILDVLYDSVLAQSKVTKTNTVEDAISQLLLGCALIVANDCDMVLCVDLREIQMRGVSESGENVIKGAKDCFVENFRVNTALLRAHYRSPELNVDEMVIGKSVQTVVAICYNRVQADKTVVDAIANKIKAFSKRGVFSSADLEDHLSRHKNKVFPQMTYSERPDKVAANINEGKIAIIIDNLPFVYITPTTFAMMMQAVEDYSRNYIVASFTRLLRYTAFFIATILPALYIAIMLYHHEMIPRDLAISLIASKDGVAFPTPFEVLFMLMAFEILVEAGLRMPKAVGPAVSIVGGLVVGQAAVSASFISSSVVVVVALTAISGYTTPDQDMGNAIKIWRLVLAILAWITGLYGLILGLITMLSLMSRMEFMEQSFLKPFVNSGGKFLQKDTLIRN